MFRTWYLTAHSDVLRREAIWVRLRPCRTQCRTRHSAGVSTSSCRGLPRGRSAMHEKLVPPPRLFPTPGAPARTSRGGRGVDRADPGAVEEHLRGVERLRVRQRVTVDGC